MTIDELIGEADRFASYAVREADRDRIEHDRIMRYTAISQACAQTVQATIMAQLARTAGLDTAIRVFE